MAAVHRDHAADAAAGHLRRADLSHDRCDPDVRPPVRDDGRRTDRFDRVARDVHPRGDARLPRFRIRVGARRAHVRAVDGRDVGLSAVHAARRRPGTMSPQGGPKGELPRTPVANGCHRRGGSPVSFSRRTVVWVAALIVVVNGFFPAVWILLTSLKTETELPQAPITYLPAPPTLDNYVTAFTAQPILRFMFNSFVVASLSTILCVFVSALAAYALTRLRIPKRNLIMSLLLPLALS